jgi:hypothetical protein
LERATHRCPPDRLGKPPERTVSSPDRPRSCCQPLTGWRYAPESPEADAGFDDWSWRLCDLTTSHRHGWANDAFKSARGLTAAGLDGDATVLAWRIQGGTGDDEPVRGPLNAGGYTKNRAGWHLPGFPDTSGSPSTCRGTGPAKASPGTARRSASIRTTTKTAVGAVDMPPAVPHAVLPGQPTNPPIMCVYLPMKSGDPGDDGP